MSGRVSSGSTFPRFPRTRSIRAGASGRIRCRASAFRRRGLRQCLDALARLSPPPLEVIVVEDGGTSADSPAYGCRRAGRAAGERRGPAAARNRGAAIARGDVLFFVDADVACPVTAVATVQACLKDPGLSRRDWLLRSEADGAQLRLAVQEPGPPLRASACQRRRHRRSGARAAPSGARRFWRWAVSTSASTCRASRTSSWVCAFPAAAGASSFGRTWK